jgi:putative restriction endonuclease
VKDHNDQRKTVLVEFVKDKKLIFSPKFEEITEANENEDDLPLFDRNRKNEKGYSKRRENNQPKFRSDVFKHYIKNNECAVCEINLFLDAAHIIPVEKRGTDNKQNGIILCKNHHKAFDDNFFKIIPSTLKIEFIEDQSNLRIKKTDIKHLVNKPANKYLEWRYKNY